MTRLAKAVAACFCIGYVVVAQRVGEQWPISRLSMWDADLREGGRIVARSSRGLEEISDFRAWECPTAVDFSPDRTEPECAGKGAHVEFDRRAEHWIRAHTTALPAGEEVTVVRRFFVRNGQGMPLVPSICELAKCRAVRTGAP